MNAKPIKGWVLLSKVVVDFTTAGSKEHPVILPVGDKSSSFFNRCLVLEMPPPELTDNQAAGKLIAYKEHPFQKGDIVVITGIAGQLSVPGTLKDDDGKRHQVMFCPIDQVVAVLRGDDAEVDEVPQREAIITKIPVNNGG